MPVMQKWTKPLRDAPEYKVLADAIRQKSEGLKVDYCTSPGNFGDALINIGTRQFFSENHIEYNEYTRDELRERMAMGDTEQARRILIVGGGGGWSLTFSSTRQFVDEIADSYHHVIVLPTTYELPPPTSRNVTCFARDKTFSASVNPNAKFCHDMAFFIKIEVPVPPKPLWRLFAFRRDIEGYGLNEYFANNIDLSLFGDGSYRDAFPFFSIISHFQIASTDRLHVGIAASLLGLRTYIVGGTYPKNKSLYEASIEPNYPRSSFVEFDSLLEILFPNRSPEESKRVLLPNLRTSESKGRQPEAISQPTSTPRSHPTPSFKLLDTNSLTLEVSSSVYRIPPRRPEDMSPDYLLRYDGHTVAADVFQAGKDLMMVGPPLLNLKTYAENATVSVDGIPLTTHRDWADLNRASRFKGRVDVPASHVSVKFGPDTLAVKVSPDQADAFEGMNAVVTLNKDNHLENVRDWLTWLTIKHDINAAVIYDNGSTTYSQQELLEVARSVPGIVSAYVINWPYKYGNTGGPKQIWDSDFGQYMCWEHARWRFFRKANCVVISDVDEIPISVDSSTLVSRAEQSIHGVFSYPVRDVPAVPRSGLNADRVHLHTDYLHSDKLRGTYSKKVVYIPSRLPAEAQVGNHQVVGVSADYSEEVISRHVAGVHLAWRSGVWEYDHPERAMSTDSEFFDSELAEGFASAFPDRF